jgi:membrane-associated protein
MSISSLGSMDLVHILESIGYFGILFIIFLETGVFFAFFLPGDSLLFTAGLLASQHFFSLERLLPGLFIAAILGYQFAYWFGARLGDWLWRRPDSLWFKRRYLHQAHDFYEQHGGFALILGRLLPIVRTFVPILAGMVHLNKKRYFLLNITGGFIWISGMTLLGYFLGRSIPNAREYLLPLVLAIVFLSASPLLWRYLRSK